MLLLTKVLEIPFWLRRLILTSHLPSRFLYPAIFPFLLTHERRKKENFISDVKLTTSYASGSQNWTDDLGLMSPAPWPMEPTPTSEKTFFLSRFFLSDRIIIGNLRQGFNDTKTQERRKNRLVQRECKKHSRSLMRSSAPRIRADSKRSL